MDPELIEAVDRIASAVYFLLATLGLVISLVVFSVVIILKGIQDRLFRLNETLRSAVVLHPDHPAHRLKVRGPLGVEIEEEPEEPAQDGN